MTFNQSVQNQGAWLLAALVGLLLSAAAQTVAAQDTAGAKDEAKTSFTFGAPFVDNAILQQGMAVPVWGTAPRGTAVYVQFAGQKKKAVADDKNTWRVTLDPLKADRLDSVNQAPEGKLLFAYAQVNGNHTTLSVKNILVGEVWLCSGQSNMAGPLKMGPWPPGTIQNANYPALRQWRDQKWVLCTPETSRIFSRVAFCFARDLQAELKVPFALLMAATGGASIESWMREVPTELQSERFKQALKRKDRLANGNYQTKLKPLIGYAIRGALWYQGEANAKEGRKYFLKMKTMIGDWRNSWSQGDFPFYFVQIASIGSSEGVGPEMGDGRAKIRNAQLEALTIKNTGMALTIDIGAVKEHPVNKYDVGLRLARWAKRNEYGQKDLVPCGPVYKGIKIEDSKIRVRFDHAGTGLMLATKKGYEPAKPTPDAEGIPWLSIQDQAGKWHWAKGEIDGKDLIVWNDKVDKPKAVRYAYTNQPTGFNLYNKEGLPASPFSSSGY